MNKIINDPVHGFIQIKFEIIQRCIDHPFFQRLRFISQLGLTNFVYPGAHHSRFHHALGAFHLMQIAIANLRTKGIEISVVEEEAACAAILLHDIGHGPYSHTLEGIIWKNHSHESISLALIDQLNEEFDHKLQLAIDIFTNKYPRKFFYQLVSSQLDVDRLDYLKRDSFYTGVVEGNIGVDRILAMIDVRDNQIVVHEKGIMSIQNYLLSRNLMYWQVYLHKTVMSAENMLVKIFERVHELKLKNGVFECSNALLSHFINHSDLEGVENLANYVKLDDSDVWQFIKELQTSEDYILSKLSKAILNRKLYKVTISENKDKVHLSFLRDENDRKYFNFSKEEKINAYTDLNPIIILKKDGQLISYEDYMRASGNIVTENNSAKKTFYYNWINDV
jgi:HD superfamily phosphohydrolase